MTNEEEITKLIINSLISSGMSKGEAELVLMEYDLSFNCERYSETWYSCRSGTEEEEFKDVEWCRPCLAERILS